MPSPLPGRPFTWQMRGLSDALDGTNAPRGAMSALVNLVPAPSTTGLFVPRPAAVALPAFIGFTSAAQITCLETIGNVAYGFISTGRNVGFDEPFAFNIATGVLYTVANVTATNVPATQATTGDWTPPTAAQVAGRIMLTHPGYAGGAIKFGWMDISGYSLTSLTATTAGTTVLNTVSASPITAGVMPGYQISSPGNIPPNTYIVSMTATTITMSNAALTSVGGQALTITGGTPTAPLYGAGDMNGNNLASVPLAVAQFSQRAYFAVGAGVSYSDSGLPCQASSTGQSLLFRNGLNTTAMAGMPLISTTQGGVVQSLIVFQGASGMQQITGDTLNNNLVVNQINNNTGTLAPNTITPLPGSRLAFMAPDGIRIVDNSATVSGPITSHGRGVSVPFRYAVFPSRACAAFNQSVLRITVQNGNKANQPYEEYWLDMAADENIWTGPHSFPAALIQPWQGNTNTFVMAPSPSLQKGATVPTKWGAFTWGAAPWGGTPIAAQLWQSDPQPSTTSVYTENGTALAWTASTVLLPDNQDASANSVIEGTLGLQLPAGVGVVFTATNETGSTLDQVQINSVTAQPTTWGAFSWGSANWQKQQANFVQYRIPFDGPVVFKQAIFSATATSAAGTSIGNLYLRVEEQNYDIQPGAAAA